MGPDSKTGGWQSAKAGMANSKIQNPEPPALPPPVTLNVQMVAYRAQMDSYSLSVTFTVLIHRRLQSTAGDQNGPLPPSAPARRQPRDAAEIAARDMRGAYPSFRRF